MRHLAWWLAGLAACSNGDEKPDDSDGDTASAPTIETAYTVTPDDGWVDVAPLANVTIAASPGFDAASFAATAVTFEDGAGRSVPFTTRAEANDTVFVIDPSRPLVYRQTYTVTIDGLVYVDGTSVPPVSIDFEVASFLPVARQETSTQVTVYSYDDERRLVGQDTFDLPGMVQTSRRVLEYNPRRTLHYDDVGPDQVWDSPDDGLAWYQTYEESATSSTWTRFAVPGDVPEAREAVTTDDDQRPLTRVTSSGIGPDEAWFTADDTFLQFFTFEYAPNGEVAREVTYSGLGTDNLLFTNDDVVSSYYTRTYGPDGLELRFTTFIGPGDNGTWFDDDDDVLSYIRPEYDATGVRTATYRYTSPGDNGEWFTSDDPISSKTTFDLDENGLAIGSTIAQDPGPDLMWSTFDDVLSLRFEDDFDSAGFLVESRTYDGPGDDGTWGDSNDQLQRRRTFLGPLPPGPRER